MPRGPKIRLPVSPTPGTVNALIRRFGSAGVQHQLVNNLEYDNSGHIGFQRQTIQAARAPGATDDDSNSGGIGSNLRAGDFWLDTAADPPSVYVCDDASTGAAVWVDFLDSINQKVPNIIGTPTINTIGSAINHYWGSGYFTGGVLSLNGVDATKVDVSAGEGVVKTTDDHTAPIAFVSFAAFTSTSVPLNGVTFFGIDYNAGSPTVVESSVKDWNYHTTFPIGYAINEGGVVRVVQNGIQLSNMSTHIYEWIEEFAPLRRTSGLVITDSGDGNRNILMTAGTWRRVVNEGSASARDTSAADSMHGYYTDGLGGWSAPVSGLTQWPNTQWDNGGTLQVMGNNKYAAMPFYLETSASGFTGTLSFVYPQAEYNSVAEAEAEPLPAQLPDHINLDGILLGRLIFQKSATTPVEIQYFYDQSPTQVSAADHLLLKNIQGGSSSEQYHMTAAQHAIATQPAASGTSGYVTAGTQDIDGVKTFLADMIIQGNLTVQGTTTTVDSTTVTVADNLTALNYGEAGAGITAGVSGFVLDRGTLNPYVFLFDDAGDYFRIGEYYHTLTYSGLAGGPFTVGEEVTGGTSGAVGRVITDNGSTTMTLLMLGPTNFSAAETITGGTSAATATASAPAVLTDSTQAVATREDTPVDGDFAQWDAATNKFITGIGFLDEDTMVSDSATDVPSQQSVKAYSDSATQTMTNKTLTSPVLNGALTGTGVKDEDDMASNSATAVPTQQSVKAYVDKFYGFSAYASTAQSIPTATSTKVQIDTEHFDPQGEFDAVTNYRYTPQKAGKYFVRAVWNHSGGTWPGRQVSQITKNGVIVKKAEDGDAGGTSGVEVTGIVDMNGSTDYLEFEAYHTAGAGVTLNNAVAANVEFEAYWLGV